MWLNLKTTYNETSVLFPAALPPKDIWEDVKVKVRVNLSYPGL